MQVKGSPLTEMKTLKKYMTTVQTDFETLAVSTKENIVTLQLNRGKANTINRQMISDLHNFFEQATNDEEVSGVIMTG